MGAQKPVAELCGAIASHGQVFSAVGQGAIVGTENKVSAQSGMVGKQTFGEARHDNVSSRC